MQKRKQKVYCNILVGGAKKLKLRGAMPGHRVTIIYSSRETK